MEYLDADAFLNGRDKIPLVDVRSPSEFNTGHISHAINIPVFTDEERAEVGTVYKHEGRLKAIETGLGIVGPKMKELTLKARSIADYNKLKVYCWRGGMRSEKMSWLFELMGIRCFVLKGGFKAYRKKLLDDFSRIKNLIVLQGPTGTGKTEILRKIKGIGEQVIDLEELARHRGSAFGDIGLGQQPTSMQFQNDIHDEIMRMNLKQRIWIESESISIGKVYLPETLWNKMNSSTIIELNIPKELRVQRIVDEYGPYGEEILSIATRKIHKRFGGNNVKQVLTDLEKRDFHGAATLLLKYYDKTYTFSREKYKNNPPVTIDSKSSDAEQNARMIINKAKELNK